MAFVLEAELLIQKVAGLDAIKAMVADATKGVTVDLTPTSASSKAFKDPLAQAAAEAQKSAAAIVLALDEIGKSAAKVARKFQPLVDVLGAIRKAGSGQKVVDILGDVSKVEKDAAAVTAAIQKINSAAKAVPPAKGAIQDWIVAQRLSEGSMFKTMGAPIKGAFAAPKKTTATPTGTGGTDPIADWIVSQQLQQGTLFAQLKAQQTAIAAQAKAAQQVFPGGGPVPIPPSKPVGPVTKPTQAISYPGQGPLVPVAPPSAPPSKPPAPGGASAAGGAGGNIPPLNPAVANNLKQAARGAADFGDSIFLAGKRYAAFIAATAAPFLIIGQIREATSAVIDFEKAMTRLRQILGGPAEDVGALRQKLLDLSVQTGVAATDLAAVAQKLTQAGFSAKDTATAMETLALVPLLPSFESVETATQGVVTVLKQFGLQATDTAHVVDVLTQVGDSFAITSEDIVQGVSRGGSAIATLGGSFEEFAALFTAIKETTQESAEAVGTSIRNMATRMSLPETVSKLEDFGVSVKDQKGNFVGVMSIFKQLSSVYDQMEKMGDKLGQVRMAESLGDMRQVGRMLAALKNFNVVEQAYATGMNADGAASRKAGMAMETVAAQLGILKAQANEFLQTVGAPMILPFLKSLIDIGKTAVSVAKQFEPLIKVLAELTAAFLAVKGIEIGSTLISRAGSYLTPALLGATSKANGIGTPPLSPGLIPTGPSAPLGGGVLAALGMSSLATKNLGGTGAGVFGGMKEAAGSPLGQYAILAATLAMSSSAKEMGASLGSAGKAAADFVADLASTAGKFVLIGSILQGLTPGQFMKTGGAGGLTSNRGLQVGAGVALGALAVGAASSNQIQEAVNTKLAEVADRIAQIDVSMTPGDTDKIKEAVKGLYKGVGDAFETVTGRYEMPDLESSGIGGKIVAILEGVRGFFAELYDRVGSLMHLDLVGAFSPDMRLLQEGRKAIDDAIRNSVDKYKQLVTSLEIEGTKKGSGWRTEFTKQTVAQGGTAQGAQETIAGIERVLGKNAMAAVEKEARRTADTAETTKRRETDYAQFSKAILPPRLTEELFRFNDAVLKATTAMNAYVTAAEAQLSALSGTKAPPMPANWTKESVQNIAQNRPQMFNNLLQSNPALARLGTTYAQIRPMMSNFAQEWAAAERKAREPGGTAVNAPSAQPRQFVERFLDEQKVPQEVRGVIKDLLDKVSESIIDQAKGDKGLVLTPQIVEKVISKNAEGMEEAAQTLFSKMAESLNALAGAYNVQLNAEASVRQFRLQAAEAGPATAGRSALYQTLREAGVNLTGMPKGPYVLGGPTEQTKQYESRGAEPSAERNRMMGTAYPNVAAENREAIDTLRERMLSVSKDLFDAHKAMADLQSGVEVSADGFKSLSNMAQLTDEFNKLLLAVDVLNKDMSQDEARINADFQKRAERITETVPPERQEGALRENEAARERAVNAAKSQRQELLNIRTEAASQIAAETKDMVAKASPSNVFATAVGRFDAAVEKWLRFTPTNLHDITEGFNGPPALPQDLREQREKTLFGGYTAQNLNEMLRDIMTRGQGTAAVEPGIMNRFTPRSASKDYIPAGTTPATATAEEWSKALDALSNRLTTEAVNAKRIEPGKAEDYETMMRQRFSEWLNIPRPFFGGKPEVPEAKGFGANPIEQAVTTIGKEELTKLNETERAVLDAIRQQNAITVGYADIQKAQQETSASPEFVPDTTLIDAMNRAAQNLAVEPDLNVPQTMPMPTTMPWDWMSPLNPNVTAQPLAPTGPFSDATGAALNENLTLLNTNLVTLATTMAPAMTAINPQAVMAVQPPMTNPTISGIATTAPPSPVDTELPQVMRDMIANNIEIARLLGTVNTGGTNTEGGGTTENEAVAAATQSQSEALNRNSANAEVLASALADTSEAVRAGLQMKLDATTSVNVNVDGLGSAIADEVRPAIEVAARSVAVDVVRRALLDVASKVDQESANAFLGAATSLG